MPFHKIKKVVRFRLSEIERWIDCGGVACSSPGPGVKEGDLFADLEAWVSLVGEEGENTPTQKKGTALVDTGGPQYDGN